MKKVKKAIIPVAGLGTRFLPATKSIPKELLPIVDRPIIQMVVDEARDAGIEQFIFVTGRHKQAIEDYFDRQFELETILERRGKSGELKSLSGTLLDPGQMSFTRQQEPLGLGHAVWCARDLIGDEPFAVLLPDVVIDGEPGCLRQLMSVHADHGGNIIAIEQKPTSELHRYGVVSVMPSVGNAMPITDMVEKPKPGTAPSDLVISGRYILEPEIFAEITRQQPGAGQEIQLTDAMGSLMSNSRFFGCKFEGEAFDCGEKAGFVSANLHFALKQPELAARLLPMITRSLAIRSNLPSHENLLAQTA